MAIRYGKPIYRKRIVQHEQLECQAFASYMRLLAPRYGITWTHVPSGGARHIKTAVALKTMGVRPGVWDYYFRKQGLPSLWIEFKHGSNKLSQEQLEWRNALAPMGDDFGVAYTALEGLAILVKMCFLPGTAYTRLGPTISIHAGPIGAG